MPKDPHQSRIDAALSSIRAHTPRTADIGIILGSGLGDAALAIKGERINYADIDGFPRATAPTHKGVMHIGDWNGAKVCALQGRFHLYEGHKPADIGFPVDVLHGLGVKTLIVSNITGSLNPDIKTGDIAAISDHVFFPGLSGQSPLVGRAQTEDRSSFVNMSRAYDKSLISMADACLGRPLPRAVYGCVAGPQFETPAEGRMLRAMGADVVGMSSVYEVVMARYYGMRVLALSLIVNPVITAPDSQDDISEDQIWQTVQTAAPKMAGLIGDVIGAITP